MRNLKCEFCGDIVYPWDEESEQYLKDYPIAANEWIEKLMTEHYQTCSAVSNPTTVGGMGSGILE